MWRALVAADLTLVALKLGAPWWLALLVAAAILGAVEL